jgi:hypothetical protein
LIIPKIWRNIIPLLIISAANGLAWPSLAKTVFSAAPREQAGSASGMFYTVYNVGRALSQVIVLLVVELGVSPQIVSQALVGIAKMRASNVTSALVRSTDSGFKFLNIFFGIQLLVTSILLFRYGANHLRIQHKA